MIRVLVVDDDFRVAQLHAAMVHSCQGFEVVGLAHTAERAVTAAAESEADLVLLDEYLPDARGSSVVGRIDAAVILITAADDGPTIRRALARGAINVVLKPFGADVLAERLKAFARFHTALDRAGVVDQPSVDRAMAILHEGDRVSAPMPKGRSAVTADAVAEALRRAPGPMTAAEVADATGVSRATAQRYLSDLSRAGRIELTLRYGSAGRPEHRYAWPGNA